MSKLAPLSTTFSLPGSVEIRTIHGKNGSVPFLRHCICIFLLFSYFPFLDHGSTVGFVFRLYKGAYQGVTKKVGGNYREILFIRQIHVKEAIV